MTPRPPVRWRDLLDYPGIYPAGLVLVVLTLTTLLVCCGRAHAADPSDVPRWLLRGIAAIETSSVIRQDGSIRYVNKARGSAGEVGVFQALPSTLRQFGFSPSLVEQDAPEAERAARHILAHYFTITGDWEGAARAWRKGLGGRNSDTARDYARRVMAAGGAP